MARRRPSMDDSDHSATSPRQRCTSMDNLEEQSLSRPRHVCRRSSNESMNRRSNHTARSRRGAARRTSMDHSRHYNNPTSAIQRTSIDHHNPEKTQSKRRKSIDHECKPKYYRRSYRNNFLQMLLGHNPIRRVWLCTCIVLGIIVCLGRNIRITLNVESDPQILTEDKFYDPAPSIISNNNLRTPKRTMPFSYNFLFYNEESLHKERSFYRQTEEEILPAVQELLESAEEALEAGPWSVTQKPRDSLAPSTDKHDYFHPAPYFWPPKSKDGILDHTAPYEYHDGERIPGAALFEKGSDNFDRSRLAAMQYNSTILGLAYFISGNEDYAEVAVRNLRVWFLHPASKMNPHLFYSQVRRNHNKDSTGSHSGIIELKDLYFFLDAIQMVMGHLEKYEVAELKDWFSKYMKYLETSEQGIAEKKTKNNHGLYFDIQQMAVANFLGDKKKLERIWRRAESRVSQQISASNGAMTEELKRNTCEHYQMFTLEGWWTLARIGENVLGEKLWVANKHALCRASEFAIPYFNKRATCPGNSQQEDDQRWWPLVVDAIGHCSSLRKKDLVWRDWMTTNSKALPNNLYDMPRMYNPHDGIAPFWNFGIPMKKSSPGFWKIKPVQPKPKSKLSTEKKTATSSDKKTANSDQQSGGALLTTKTTKINSFSGRPRTPSKSSSPVAIRNISSALGGLLVTKSKKATGSTSATKPLSASSFPPKLPTPKQIFFNSKLSSTGAKRSEPADDYIPAIMKKAAKKNPKYADRIERLKRWQKLGQTKIVQKMIKNSLDELIGTGYDR